MPEQPVVEIMIAPLSSRAPVAVPAPVSVSVYQNDVDTPRANRALFEFFQKELLQVLIPSTSPHASPLEYQCYCIIQDNAPASISIPPQDQDQEEDEDESCPNKGKHKLCPLVWSNSAYTSAHRYMLEQQLLAASRWESYANMDQKSLSLPPKRAPLTEYEQLHQDCDVCHSHHGDGHGDGDEEQQQEKEQAVSTCANKSCTAPKAPRRSRSPPPSPPLSPSSCCESNHYHQHHYQQREAPGCTNGNDDGSGGGSPKNSIARMAWV